MENDKRITRQEAARAAFVAAFQKELSENPPPDGVFDPSAYTYNAIQRMKREDPENAPMHEAQLVLKGAVPIALHEYERSVTAEAKADARQGVLARKGFELVKPAVRVEGVITPVRKISWEQRLETDKQRKSRIKRNTYPRWSEERMKQEKAADRQETKLTRQVAPLMGGNKQLDFGFGLDKLEEKLESPKVTRWSKGGKAKAEKAKKRRDLESIT